MIWNDSESTWTNASHEAEHRSHVVLLVPADLTCSRTRRISLMPEWSKDASR